jgi:hypothetical protein
VRGDPVMTVRTTRSSVTFRSPFRLVGIDHLQPAGTYDVETDEDIIEGNEHTVYRRVATILYVRSAGMTPAFTVDPEDLQASLARDGE